MGWIASSSGVPAPDRNARNLRLCLKRSDGCSLRRFGDLGQLDSDFLPQKMLISRTSWGKMEAKEGKTPDADVLLLATQICNPPGDRPRSWQVLPHSNRASETIAITGVVQVLRKTSWQQNLTIAALGAIGATASVLGAAPAQAASITLDSFDEAHQVILFPSFAPPFLNDPTEIVSGSSILGGEREVILERTSGTNSIDSSGGLVNDDLIFNSPSGTSGQVTLIYDGADGDLNNIDFGGLQSTDLTGGGTNDGWFFTTTQVVSLNGGVDLTVYTDQNNFSTGRIDIFSGAPSAFSLLFDDFTVGGGTGADFSNVGAIVLELGGEAAFDVAIDQFDFAPSSAIPEGEMTVGTVIALGLLGGFKLRQRANKRLS